MPPSAHGLAPRSYNNTLPSHEFYNQWLGPGDVFSVLLILGGDVVQRALAQLAGTRLAPVAFSFGWVAYSIAAVTSVIGENKLMPQPDYACLVINGEKGYVRQNASWVIGRIVRDYEYWMAPKVRRHLDAMLRKKFDEETEKAAKKGSKVPVAKPIKAGLCVSFYAAADTPPRKPYYDWVYWIGYSTAVFQLGIAAIPCGIWEDWSTLIVTACGIILSFATGSLPQWRKEKWACRRNCDKWVILTRGNGSQHAIVIIGEGRGLDLEDLAASDFSAPTSTTIFMVILAFLWVMLLITAAGIQKNTWFLLAVGGLGILQNILVAGWKRNPKALGVPLTFHGVIGETKAMKTLLAVERYGMTCGRPGLGRSMLATFFPGTLTTAEEEEWNRLRKEAEDDSESEEPKHGVPGAATVDTQSS